MSWWTAVAIAVPALASAGDPAPSSTARLSDVTVTAQVETTTVRIKTSALPKYKAALFDSPDRLVVDLQGTTYAWRKAPLEVTGDSLKQIRGSQFQKGVARLVLELRRRVPYTIDEEPDGLTIRIATSTKPLPRAVAHAGELPAIRSAGESPSIRPVETTVTAQPVALAAASAAPSAPETMAEPPSASREESTPVPPPAPVRAAQAPAPVTVTPPAPAPVLAAQAPKSATVKPPASVPVVAAQAPAPVTVTPPPVVVAPAPAAAVTPVPGNGQRLISLDFKDADVINLLRILAAESGRNIVIGEDVKGKMSIALHNVPWDLALATILETRGLQRVDRDGVIRIVSTEQLTKEREAKARIEEAKLKSEADVRAKVAEAEVKEAEAQSKKLAAEAAAKEAEARGPLREETIRLSYADPEEVAKTLQGILGIPAEGAPIKGPGVINGPIAEPPFSQLFGPPQAPTPVAPVSVSQDVLSKGLTIRAHKPTNTLFLRLYAADLERVKKIIRESLDIPLPQIKIEARMEILDRNALEQIGVQWGGMFVSKKTSPTLVGQGLQTTQVGGQTVPFIPGMVQGTTNVIDQTPPVFTPSNPNFPLFPAKADSSGGLPVSFQTGLPLGGNLVNLPISALPNAGPLPAGGLLFGIVGTNFNVNLALQALAEQGKTRTLARPEIVTVENNRATVSLGEEIPYATISSAGTQIQFKEALLKLEVTPTVVRENGEIRIKMVVVVENNSRGATVNLGNAGQPPAINRRKAETLVLIREGERLVIGGVTTNVTQNTTRKVPLLGDVPVLGWLFKQKENFEQGREMVVFLTPSILTPTGAVAPTPAPSK